MRRALLAIALLLAASAVRADVTLKMNEQDAAPVLVNYAISWVTTPGDGVNTFQCSSTEGTVAPPVKKTSTATGGRNNTHAIFQCVTPPVDSAIDFNNLTDLVGAFATGEGTPGIPLQFSNVVIRVVSVTGGTCADLDGCIVVDHQIGTGSGNASRWLPSPALDTFRRQFIRGAIRPVTVLANRSAAIGERLVLDFGGVASNSGSPGTAGIAIQVGNNSASLLPDSDDNTIANPPEDPWITLQGVTFGFQAEPSGNNLNISPPPLGSTVDGQGGSTILCGDGGAVCSEGGLSADVTVDNVPTTDWGHRIWRDGLASCGATAAGCVAGTAAGDVTGSVTNETDFTLTVTETAISACQAGTTGVTDNQTAEANRVVACTSSGGAPCTGTYQDDNSRIVAADDKPLMTISLGSNCLITGWSGACSPCGNDTTCEITVDAPDQTCTLEITDVGAGGSAPVVFYPGPGITNVSRNPAIMWEMPDQKVKDLHIRVSDADPAGAWTAANIVWETNNGTGDVCGGDQECIGGGMGYYVDSDTLRLHGGDFKNLLVGQTRLGARTQYWVDMRFFGRDSGTWTPFSVAVPFTTWCFGSECVPSGTERFVDTGGADAGDCTGSPCLTFNYAINQIVDGAGDIITATAGQTHTFAGTNAINQANFPDRVWMRTDTPGTPVTLKTSYPGSPTSGLTMTTLTNMQGVLWEDYGFEGTSRDLGQCITGGEPCSGSTGPTSCPGSEECLNSEISWFFSNNISNSSEVDFRRVTFSIGASPGGIGGAVTGITFKDSTSDQSPTNNGGVMPAYGTHYGGSCFNTTGATALAFVDYFTKNCKDHLPMSGTTGFLFDGSRSMYGGNHPMRPTAVNRYFTFRDSIWGDGPEGVTFSGGTIIGISVEGSTFIHTLLLNDLSGAGSVGYLNSRNNIFHRRASGSPFDAWDSAIVGPDIMDINYNLAASTGDRSYTWGGPSPPGVIYGSGNWAAWLAQPFSPDANSLFPEPNLALSPRFVSQPAQDPTTLQDLRLCAAVGVPDPLCVNGASPAIDQGDPESRVPSGGGVARDLGAREAVSTSGVAITPTPVGGTVTDVGASNPINCGDLGSDCTSDDSSATFTLHQVITPLWAFRTWSGTADFVACGTNPADCPVDSTSPITGTAQFETGFTFNSFTDTCSTAGTSITDDADTSDPGATDRVVGCTAPGVGGSACDAEYRGGVTIRFTVAPAAGCHVIGWSDACAGCSGTFCDVDVDTGSPDCGIVVASIPVASGGAEWCYEWDNRCVGGE